MSGSVVKMILREICSIRRRISLALFQLAMAADIAATLLNTTLYPASRIRDLYQGRWKIEESFRDLKDSRNYGFIRSRSPASVIKTLKVALIARNLVRAIGATAAHRHRVRWERISFKGATVSIRLFLIHRLVRGTTLGVANFQRLLVAIATDLVEERPGRREPRAVKKRAKPYPLLTCNRHDYQEIPHRSHDQKSKESAEVSAIHACPLIFA